MLKKDSDNKKLQDRIKLVPASDEGSGHSAVPRPKTEHKSGQPLFRSIVIIAVFFCICVAYALSLIRIIRTFDAGTVTDDDTYTVKTVTVQAVRGEIFDRNGKALVSNEYKYSLRLEYGLMSEGYAAQNRDIADLVNYLEKIGRASELQLTYCPLVGSYPDFDFDEEKLENSALTLSKLKRIASELELGEDASASDLSDALVEKYRLTDKNGESDFTDSELGNIILLRYEMEAIQFAPGEPLLLLEDIGMDVITGIEELGIPGTSISVSYTRIYNYPGYASHILGRISRIYAEEVEKYTSLGYPVNALVGVEGCELAFEEYLRGSDGEMKITCDENGKIVSTEITKEPKAGQDVYLTIDIDLQIAAEEALEENIRYVNEKAEKTAGDFDGEDCDSGALVVEEIGTGAILALASYPSYDLTTYSQNYASLLADERKPLINRALEGTYAPGSTFKVCVAAGALTEGTVMADGTEFSANSIINTQGIYTYYDDYQPACWLYAYGHQKHGKINVTRAIEVSCNCFFYELGRCMGIDSINYYATKLGLGQKSGIELHESLGVLADRAYTESIGTVWTGGVTIQTAIGQGFNRFTPIQIASYLATVVDGGQRYSAHLLDRVNEFSGETVYTYEPTVVSSINFSGGTQSTLINAMSKVVDENANVTAFDTFPIKVGGKTGSAEVYGQSKNAIFMGFAPLNAPEIAVSCVLERGSAGANAAIGVRLVMDKYFSDRLGNN